MRNLVEFLQAADQRVPQDGGHRGRHQQQIKEGVVGQGETRRQLPAQGRPHPEWGEEVVAFVVGTAEPAELDRLCTENIARFKRPKAYFDLNELPKNNYGKVLKTELRKRLEEDQ